MFPLERITQNVVKSHIETSQYSTEELKKLAWTLYTPEEMRVYQNKVSVTNYQCIVLFNTMGCNSVYDMYVAIQAITQPYIPC